MKVATIKVEGPVGCGKSIVMDRIRRTLELEFGADVALNRELRSEVNSCNYEKLADWQSETIKDTVWVLIE